MAARNAKFRVKDRLREVFHREPERVYRHTLDVAHSMGVNFRVGNDLFTPEGDRLPARMGRPLSCDKSLDLSR